MICKERAILFAAVAGTICRFFNTGCCWRSGIPPKTAADPPAVGASHCGSGAGQAAVL